MAITSGTPVKSGFYWNARSWSFAKVERDGDALGGAPGERWVRVSTPLVLAAAPVLGGVFVVALPFLGLAAVGMAIARRIGGGVKESAGDLAANLAPGPIPGEAHLTGKPGAEGAAAAKDAKLEELERDIGEKRGR